MSLKEKIKQNPELKRRLLNAMVHPVKTRPRGWLRLFRRFYTERGKGSVVCRNARLDIVPFNPFSLGARSVTTPAKIVHEKQNNKNLVNSHTNSCTIAVP